MSMLTKAMARCEAVARSSAETAVRMKSQGLLQAMGPDAYGTGFGQWREQAKGREQYASFRGVLYAAVNAIALHGASQPVVIGRLKDAKEKPGGTKAYLPGRKRVAGGRKAADEVEVVEDHPLVEVMEQPNPFQNRWQFTYGFLANINLTGRAYIVQDWNAKKKRMELYSLPTTWVEPVVDRKKGLIGWSVGDPGMPSTSRADFKPEQVAHAYLPHPADPRLAMAPAESQMPAIKVDEKIWRSREVFFDNGIFPSCIVTVGQNPHPEASNQAGRPVLTLPQRKQVNAAIKRAMSGVQNFGNPAIVDGLIERIDRLSMNSEEMGWEKSAAETKTAILSAFAVHPYILGEHMPGSMAQARIIKELFYERVNIFLDMLSNVVSTIVSGMGGEETVYVWWEKKTFSDAEMRWRQFMDMRKVGDVNQNELRAEAGLPPDEDGTPDLISTHASHIVQMLTQKGQGMMTAEQGVAFVVGLGVPRDVAERIVGHNQPQEPAGGPSAAVPGEGASEQGQDKARRQGPSGDDLRKAVAALRETPVDVSKAVAKLIVENASREN